MQQKIISINFHNEVMIVLKRWLRAMAITVGDQLYEWALDDSFYLIVGNRYNLQMLRTAIRSTLSERTHYQSGQWWWRHDGPRGLVWTHWRTFSNWVILNVREKLGINKDNQSLVCQTTFDIQPWYGDGFGMLIKTILKYS